MSQYESHSFAVGKVQIHPEIKDGELISIGRVTIDGVAVRNPSNRFLPWFDTYEGDVFRKFKWIGIEQEGPRMVIRTQAQSDPDVLFRERRDSSGDLCFRASSWDSEPLTADFRIVFEPMEAQLDGHDFHGFKYWFEYESDNTAIHRLVDRQTWELGGTVEDLNLCLRNWAHEPLIRMGRDIAFSTGGLVHSFVVAFPGNLWGRWSLLPAFDMQYNASGTLLGWFDQVSLIRTLVESNEGEDWLRVLDMHFFEQSPVVRTNPKTILFSPDPLDDVDAVNLWTRVYDQEKEKACSQFGIKEEEPLQICFDDNVWCDIRFDTTYEETMKMAEEFGADYLFIDPVWENGEGYRMTIQSLLGEERLKGTILEKLRYQNQCCTYDYKVADIYGGVERLKALCERAASKGMKVMSWMASHYTPRRSPHLDEGMGQGSLGMFAARESASHPDTGYPSECWPVNLNTPVMERLRDQILEACRETGIAGFLWDSFSNLGWWQLDYADGTMRPQFDRMAKLYSDLANSGLYMRPEAIVAFSSHSCCGMANGDYYPVGLLSCYSYDTQIAFHFSADWQQSNEFEILKGKLPIDQLFHWIANKHVPTFHYQMVPREEWDPESAAKIKELIGVYKKYRHRMKKRTVLKDGAGVLWEGGNGERLLYNFANRMAQGKALDALTGEDMTGKALKANCVYLMK